MTGTCERVTTTSRGFVHESTHNESKEWYTPPFIFEALGLRFDLDVASPGADVVPWVPAERHLTFEDSGLLTRWEGKVWCNPPYGSDTRAWASRFCLHGNGVMLVYARTGTNWFHQCAPKADLLCFVKGRIKFLRPDGSVGTDPGADSLLMAFGDECVAAVRNSGLGFCTSSLSTGSSSPVATRPSSAPATEEAHDLCRDELSETNSHFLTAKPRSCLVATNGKASLFL